MAYEAENASFPEPIAKISDITTFQLQSMSQGMEPTTISQQGM